MKKEILTLCGGIIKEREIITLEEYKKRVKHFLFKLDDEFLTDCADNEVYKLENQFHSSIRDKTIEFHYSSVFKKRTSIDQYIHEAYDDILPYFEEKNLNIKLSDVMSWRVVKFKLSKSGEYESICAVDLDAYGKVINICCMYVDLAPEFDILRDGEFLSFEDPEVINVDLPFNWGDILVVNDSPYDTDKYFVFLYDHDITDCRTGYYFIGIDFSGDMYMDSYLRLEHHFTYHSFPLCRIKKVSQCPVDILNKAGKMFIDNPDLLKQLKDLWYKENDSSRQTEILKQFIETGAYNPGPNQ